MDDQCSPLGRALVLAGLVLLTAGTSHAGHQDHLREIGERFFTCPGKIGTVKTASFMPFQARFPTRCYARMHRNPKFNYPTTYAEYDAEFVVTFVGGTYNYNEKLLIKGVTIVQANFACASNPWLGGNPHTACSAIEPGRYRFNSAHVGIFYEDKDLLHRSLAGVPSSSAPWSATLTTAGVATLLADMKKEAEFQEDHKDMNLAPDSGPPELSIREPRGEVRGNVASFRLTVDSTAAVPNGAVAEIEWARIVPAKDNSLNPKGDWRNGEPAGAPLTLHWSGLPATIPIHGVFEPGRYAVRVKIQGTQLDSHWQEFTVAPKSSWGTVREVPRGLGIGTKPQWIKAPALAPSAAEQPATVKTPPSSKPSPRPKTRQLLPGVPKPSQAPLTPQPRPKTKRLLPGVGPE